jgi:hypothetical protein
LEILKCGTLLYVRAQKKPEEAAKKADSSIYANGPQTWELKRVHSVQAFSRDSGLPEGPNDDYRLRNRGCMARAANRRANLAPSEYEA